MDRLDQSVAPQRSERHDSSPVATGSCAASDQRWQIPKIIPFETLARCGDEIWIENQGSIYRLRRTRQGKLILTK